MSETAATYDAGKPRIDAWDAHLTDAQRWAVYDRMRSGRWYEVAAWARDEFGLAAEPSRSALYRFADRLRKLEGARRIERALAARDEAGALVAAQTDDADTIAAYKAMAQDLALAGRAEEALRYTKMALDLAAAQTTAAELRLKQKRLEQQEESNRLAREKFEAAEARLATIRDAVASGKTDGGLSAEALEKIEEAARLL